MGGEVPSGPDGLQKGREREGHRHHRLHDRRAAGAAGLGPQILEQGAKVGAGVSVTSRVSGLLWKYQRQAEGRPMYRRPVQKTTRLLRTEGLLTWNFVSLAMSGGSLPASTRQSTG